MCMAKSPINSETDANGRVILIEGLKLLMQLSLAARDAHLLVAPTTHTVDMRHATILASLSDF